MNRPNRQIKARGFGLSGLSAFYLGIVSYLFIFAGLLLLLMLSEIFPGIRGNDGLLVILYCMPFALLLVHLVLSFYTVTLTEETVILSWLGVPLRKLSVEQLHLFCVVGNRREDVLCLTSRTVEEMALLEERCLLRNFFTKCDVPLIKKKYDWQDVLARKYLNRLRRSPKGIHRDKKTVFLFMDPVVQWQIQQMYPQLPYKNYTGITKEKGNLFLDKTKAPCFCVSSAPCYAEIQNDDIILRTKKEIKRKIPLANIKTVVRVDVFLPYNKLFPHHTPVLFLSGNSPEEMVAMAWKRENESILQAYRYAEREAQRWSVNKENCCNLLYTPEMEAQLRDLCEHTEWIDISDSWLADRP